ncbi:aspartate aminotransferase family protein [Ferrimicrobium acidiphilum]|jgi:4-aminobutyrate aminotransferase|uniref:(S)-3-amino-2-methylpropionate transaminase n=1 Tax=Ferrimicrobium acidiphilum DSM 19497 TaxID=1121877 RepID=A0A0D8FYL7_9ACTN|nr:aminotransferase class III-fold pyridoxal phosphate-dependent enzyme [Ferrimicrobium acidiphilum]KJE78199.1 5-aminovalerate aminotransferase DavT [Ferrimicrobium acidiphilum DSM 19497]MCL5053518.1 aminotransferase class III-fold pyridoxal phosphate-dependent enzyme [Gammaproteobacteria bacterium]
MAHLAPVWSKLTPLTVVRGEGALVFDTEGTSYLDATSGIAVTSTGHSHPKVAQAIAEQAQKFIHAQVNIYTYHRLQELADRLEAITPEGIDTFFFSNSGAEATEAAVKLARQYTKRTNLIVFQGSFHGRTAQAMAMTTSRTGYRAGYQPLPAGVFVSLFPGFPRAGGADGASVDEAIDYLDYLLAAQTAPNETAAMVIEPVLGEGGYLPAPAEFLQAIRERCTKHGILFVADEVQTGFGRTGRMFAVEHSNITPDIIVMAKGIASGFPFSGIGSSLEIMKEWTVGSHGGTYGANPIGVAAAIATIDVIKEEGLVENAAARGAQLSEGLRKIAESHKEIGKIRSLGLMVGVEIVDPVTGSPDPSRTSAILKDLFNTHRIIAMNAGTFGNIIRWMPPLIISERQIATILEGFEASVKATT